MKIPFRGKSLFPEIYFLLEYSRGEREESIPETLDTPLETLANYTYENIHIRKTGHSDIQNVQKIKENLYNKTHIFRIRYIFNTVLIVMQVPIKHHYKMNIGIKYHHQKQNQGIF